MKGHSFKFGYYDFTVPLAVTIIAKGKALTTLEFHEVVRKYAQSIRNRRARTTSSRGVGGYNDGASTRSGGGNKRGKKWKK